MKKHPFSTVSETQFIDFCVITYGSNETIVQHMNHWLVEQGIHNIKKRRQHIVEFLQSVHYTKGNHQDVHAILQKLQDFWFEHALKKVLSI